MKGCYFCDNDGGEILWRSERCRVIVAQEPDYPGFCRVIWNDHVAEMTDLGESDRDYFMKVVYATEAAQRAVLEPEKINLASLGNLVPHLHWHVIARYRDDKHYPNPIWGKVERASAAPRTVSDLADLLGRALREQLDGGNQH